MCLRLAFTSALTKWGTYNGEQVTGEPVAAPALAAWTYLADFAHSLEASAKDDSHVG